MRRSLQYPPLEAELVAKLIPLADELDDLASAGRECARQCGEFNALAGTSIEEPLEFHFSGACTAEEFVRDRLARRHLHEFADLDDDQLLQLLHSIKSGACPDEMYFWLAVLELNLPGVPVSDLIFHPKQALDALAIGSEATDELTAEDILRIARASRPRAAILLGPSTAEEG